MDAQLSCQFLIKQRKWSKPTHLLIWRHFYPPCATLLQREYERLGTGVTGHKKENVNIHSYPGNSSLVKWVAAVGSALTQVPQLCCCSGSLHLRDGLQTWEGFRALHIPAFSGTLKIQASLNYLQAGQQGRDTQITPSLKTHFHCVRCT